MAVCRSISATGGFSGRRALRETGGTVKTKSATGKRAGREAGNVGASELGRVVRHATAQPPLRPQVLRPEVAEHVVDELRGRFGLGQAYHLRVHENAKGDWDVEDGRGAHVVVHPMSAGRFVRWFYEQYGDVICERCQTTEG